MAIRRWSELSGRQRAAVLGVGSVQLLLAVTAWADLARRPADAIHGRKVVWAALIAVNNWIGPLSYFRWGRRR